MRIQNWKSFCQVVFDLFFKLLSPVKFQAWNAIFEFQSREGRFKTKRQILI